MSFAYFDEGERRPVQGSIYATEGVGRERAERIAKQADRERIRKILGEELRNDSEAGKVTA